MQERQCSPITGEPCSGPRPSGPWLQDDRARRVAASGTRCVDKKAHPANHCKWRVVRPRVDARGGAPTGRVRREAIEAICELNHELLRPATKRWWRPCVQLPGATAGIAHRSERIPGVLDRAHEALGKRHPKSRSRGRRGVPAEARARSARQSGVPRLHACGQRQGARRQDHGPLGRGGGAAGAGTGSRQDGGHRPTLLAQPGRPPGGALLRRRR